MGRGGSLAFVNSLTRSWDVLVALFQVASVGSRFATTVSPTLNSGAKFSKGQLAIGSVQSRVATRTV
jgi:hypothetical protein